MAITDRTAVEHLPHPCFVLGDGIEKRLITRFYLASKSLDRPDEQLRSVTGRRVNGNTCAHEDGCEKIHVNCKDTDEACE